MKVFAPFSNLLNQTQASRPLTFSGSHVKNIQVDRAAFDSEVSRKSRGWTNINGETVDDSVK